MDRDRIVAIMEAEICRHRSMGKVMFAEDHQEVVEALEVALEVYMEATA